MPPVEIARLTESTAEVVAQLNVLIPQLKPAWDPITVDGLAAVIESPTRVYVARCDGIVVGVTLLVPHRHLPGLRFHVEDVVVHEDFRRRGIARRIISTAMDEAPAEVMSFDVRSNRRRPAAHELYTALGFEPSDTTVFRRTIA